MPQRRRSRQRVATLKPGGRVVQPHAEVLAPGGRVVRPHAEVLAPGGQVVRPHAEVLAPGGQVVRPYAEVLAPDGRVVRPHAEVLAPGGRVIGLHMGTCATGGQRSGWPSAHLALAPSIFLHPPQTFPDLRSRACANVGHLQESGMRTPVFVGLIELEQQPWVDVGALVLAHQLSVPGHRVVVIDGDPCSAYLSDWARALPGQGAALLPLLHNWMLPSEVALATQAVADLVHDEPMGDIGVMRAADDAPERRPAAPSARAVRSLRSTLSGLTLDGEPVDIVLVRLAPLSSNFGTALAANLCDVLVPIVEPTPSALRRASDALVRVSALRGEPLPVFPVEMSTEDPWDANANKALWLTLLRLMPMSRARPWPVGRPRLERVFRLTPELTSDFRDLADALLLQLDLAHPVPEEHVMRGDALDDAQGVYDGFARMLEEDAPVAIKFYYDTLAQRGSTRKSTVAALRAMDHSPKCDYDDVAWGFKYAIQKFRPAEPDALAEYMNELGERLLASLRAGLVEDGKTRLLIDVADAMLKCANYRAHIKQPVEELARRAERLLLEAAGEVTKPEDSIRLAYVLGHHARLAAHARHVDLAIDLLKLGVDANCTSIQYRRWWIDVVAAFLLIDYNEALGIEFRGVATSLLKEDARYAQHNLMFCWALAGNKEKAIEHLWLLGDVNLDAFKEAFANPTLNALFLGIATPDFYNAVPKKDES